SGVEIGDSIAVDGICLTVEQINSDGFTATASPETLRRTTLGKRLSAAETVNLESSLRVGSKIGGHFVTGHIDGVATLIESAPTAQAWEMCFGVARGFETQWQQNIVPYLVDKGSITINGISLTIAESDSEDCWF
ncbi:MAG: riboflavin synthase, partial [Phototrophicales bacterium]